MKVRLVDGPGECAGRVEIKHKGRWQRVVKDGWTETNSDVVCRELGCGGKRKTVNPDVFSQGSGDFLAKIVDCTSKASRISECIKSDRNNAATNRNKEEAQGITCEGECFFHLSVYLLFDFLLLCLTIIVQFHTISNSREVCINVLE